MSPDALRFSESELTCFHCDLAWNTDLVALLNSQDRLTGLYTDDYTSYPAAVKDAMDTSTVSLSTSSTAL